MKMMLRFVVVGICILHVPFFVAQQRPDQNNKPQKRSAFSISELDFIQPNNLVEPSFLPASDGVQLAYYNFADKLDENVAILYADAGLYGNKTYQWVARTLQEWYGIGCYIVDVRGHGHSQGKRGDAPSIQQVFDDVACAVEFVKDRHEHAKIYLVGHSSGAGLLINF